MNLENDLKRACRIINGHIPRNIKFNTMFPFTTENLNGYMSKYDFREKKVLTVGSSCDQILNAYLMGACDITCFDINPLTPYHFYLKKACLESLSFEEFKLFYCYLYYPGILFNNRKAFNHKAFDKLVCHLEGESLYFWSELFSQFKGLKIRKNLFISDEVCSYILEKTNAYFNFASYYKLKDTITRLNPKFITCDIRDISKVLDTSYDYIMLSNISSFSKSLYSDGLNGLRDNIVEISKFLKNSGVMFFAYLYDFNIGVKYNNEWDLIYDLARVFDIFRGYNISYESFKGIQGIEQNIDSVSDMVLTFRK